MAGQEIVYLSEFVGNVEGTVVNPNNALGQPDTFYATNASPSWIAKWKMAPLPESMQGLFGTMSVSVVGQYLDTGKSPLIDYVSLQNTQGDELIRFERNEFNFHGHPAVKEVEVVYFDEGTPASYKGNIKVSPNNRFVAIASPRTGNPAGSTEAFVIDTETGERRDILDVGGSGDLNRTAYLAASNDGNRVVAVVGEWAGANSKYRIYHWNSSISEYEYMYTIPDISFQAYGTTSQSFAMMALINPAGTIVAVGTQTGLWGASGVKFYDLTQTTATELSATNTYDTGNGNELGGTSFSNTSSAWSPDGRYFAFATANSASISTPRELVFLFDTSTSPIQLRIPAGLRDSSIYTTSTNRVIGVKWTPDSQYLLVVFDRAGWIRVLKRNTNETFSNLSGYFTNPENPNESIGRGLTVDNTYIAYGSTAKVGENKYYAGASTCQVGRGARFGYFCTIENDAITLWDTVLEDKYVQLDSTIESSTNAVTLVGTSLHFSPKGMYLFGSFAHYRAGVSSFFVGSNNGVGYKQLPLGLGPIWVKEEAPNTATGRADYGISADDPFRSGRLYCGDSTERLLYVTGNAVVILKLYTDADPAPEVATLSTPAYTFADPTAFENGRLKYGRHGVIFSEDYITRYGSTSIPYIHDVSPSGRRAVLVQDDAITFNSSNYTERVVIQEVDGSRIYLPDFDDEPTNFAPSNIWSVRSCRFSGENKVAVCCSANGSGGSQFVGVKVYTYSGANWVLSESIATALFTITNTRACWSGDGNYLFNGRTSYIDFTETPPAVYTLPNEELPQGVLNGGSIRDMVFSPADNTFVLFYHNWSTASSLAKYKLEAGAWVLDSGSSFTASGGGIISPHPEIANLIALVSHPSLSFPITVRIVNFATGASTQLSSSHPNPVIAVGDGHAVRELLWLPRFGGKNTDTLIAFCDAATERSSLHIWDVDPVTFEAVPVPYSQLPANYTLSGALTWPGNFSSPTRNVWVSEDGRYAWGSSGSSGFCYDNGRRLSPTEEELVVEIKVSNYSDAPESTFALSGIAIAFNTLYRLPTPTPMAPISVSGSSALVAWEWEPAP